MVVNYNSNNMSNVNRELTKCWVQGNIIIVVFLINPFLLTLLDVPCRDVSILKLSSDSIVPDRKILKRSSNCPIFRDLMDSLCEGAIAFQII